MKVPERRTSSEIEIKNSRFIAIAEQAASRDEVKHIVETQWKEDPGADHIVWAFQSGSRGDIFGMSDDGEPKGTAGRPVMEVIRGSGISDLLVMVIRYFGGTKLGTGGLVKAYTQAASEVLAKLPTDKRISRLPFRLSIAYSPYQRAREALESLGAKIEHETFASEVTIEGTIPEESRPDAEKTVADLTSGASRLSITGEAHF